MKKFHLSIILCTVPILASADDPVTYICTFTEYVSKDTVKSETVEPFILTYVATPQQTLLVGNNGSAEVDWYYGEVAVTFTENLISGAVQTTTIDVMGNSNPYPAVHSRHTILAGMMLPSQYYGACTIN